MTSGAALGVLGHAGPSPWTWYPHPESWLLVGVIGVLYVRALRRHPSGAARSATGWQKLSFGAGLFFMLAAAEWPIHELAEGYLFSVHMFQHFLLSLVAPALLLAGLPEWLLRRLTSPPLIHRTLARVCRPLIAGVLFNAFIVASHWPVWVDATLRSEVLHFGAHALLFTSALVMWFPVVNTLPDLPRMSHPGRMLYLFLQSVVPTVPASFLTFAEQPVYDFYASVPRPFPLTVIEDQQLAGAFMKLGGGALLWGIIIVMFFRWYALEQQQQPAVEAEAVLTWADVEREFERSAPPREP